MKENIKRMIPPVFMDRLLYLKNHRGFLKHKKSVHQNIGLKDKHKGERCFILGSGPSIKTEDLKPLKNEVIFALNNFYVHDDFTLLMNPIVSKYYMVAPIHPPQSEDEWVSWFEDMAKHMPKNAQLILGLNIYVCNIKYLFDKCNLFKDYKVNWYFSGVTTGESYRFNSRDIDISNMIWNANAASVYALMSAIYMGFDEIYLLGVDHNYMCHTEEKSRFYKNALHQKEEKKRSMSGRSYAQHAFTATARIFNQYQILKDHSDASIYNCSSESLLDIFEYKNLKNIL